MFIVILSDERTEIALKKVVTFSETALPLATSPDGEAEEEQQPSPNELPTPLPSTPSSPVKLPGHPQSGRGSRLKSGKGSTATDPSLVLTYLKKNLYDDRGKSTEIKVIFMVCNGLSLSWFTLYVRSMNWTFMYMLE